jgi:mannose-6-phosphate isomerase-like protein (cupin superfamily)
MAKMAMTRREVCRLLPAAAIIPAASAFAATQQQDSSLPSASYPFDKLPVHKMNSGAERRDILTGKLATGESLETHETTLQPGGMPHPPHHHVHSEMWLIREGTLELTMNGKSYQLGPGSVGFVHSNDEHGVKNIGTTPATYFVVAVGPGAGSV